MKIFGIEIFKKSDSSLKIEILFNLLQSLSIDEQETLFYDLVDIIKDNEYITYELNSYNKFEYPNLHSKLNNLFSTFKFFEIGIEERFGHIFIKNLIDIDSEPISEHIQIGELQSTAYYVRYNSLYIYDEELYDDCEQEEDGIDFFTHLNLDILYELNQVIELNNYEKHIQEEYILKLIEI